MPYILEEGKHYDKEEVVINNECVDRIMMMIGFVIITLKIFPKKKQTTASHAQFIHTLPNRLFHGCDAMWRNVMPCDV